MKEEGVLTQEELAVLEEAKNLAVIRATKELIQSHREGIQARAKILIPEIIEELRKEASGEQA